MSDGSFGCVTDSKPIMVSGVYRSGTTFMSALLGAHSRLRASSSTVKFLRFCLERYGDMTDPENRRRLVMDTQRRLKVRWNLDIDPDAILSRVDEFKEPSYARLYDVIMRDMLTDSPTQRWVEKLAVQWRDIPHFLNMFPNGKVIHIFRDPRDVAASYKKMTFEPGFTYLDAAFNFRDAKRTIDQLEPEYGNRIMAVKAEDIAADAETQNRAICSFLDLDFEPSMVDANQLHTEGEDWSSNTSYEISEKRFPDAKSRWPDQLNRSEVIFLEIVSQPYFSELGYRASGYVPTSEEWNEIFHFIEDPFIKERFADLLARGEGAQGYRTDPYTHEMKIVFPERFA